MLGAPDKITKNNNLEIWMYQNRKGKHCFIINNNIVLEKTVCPKKVKWENIENL
jgi:hypothetical protein